jgi:hypothetical protein
MRAAYPVLLLVILGLLIAAIVYDPAPVVLFDNSLVTDQQLEAARSRVTVGMTAAQVVKEVQAHWRATAYPPNQEGIAHFRSLSYWSISARLDVHFDTAGCVTRVSQLQPHGPEAAVWKKR